MGWPWVLEDGVCRSELVNPPLPFAIVACYGKKSLAHRVLQKILRL